MDLAEKLRAWWDELDDQQRAFVLSAAGEIPEWVAHGLQEAGIVIVRAELTDVVPSRIGFFLPAAVADFVESKRDTSLEP